MRLLVSASMRHADKFEELKNELEQLGYVVDMPVVRRGYTKRQYIDMHLSKLREVDALYIANFDDDRAMGYVGASCFFEAGWAFTLNKPVYLLNPVAEGSPYKEDLDAIGAEVLRVEAMK